MDKKRLEDAQLLALLMRATPAQLLVMLLPVMECHGGSC